MYISLWHELYLEFVYRAHVVHVLHFFQCQILIRSCSLTSHGYMQIFFIHIFSYVTCNTGCFGHWLSPQHVYVPPKSESKGSDSWMVSDAVVLHLIILALSKYWFHDHSTAMLRCFFLSVLFLSSTFAAGIGLRTGGTYSPSEAYLLIFETYCVMQ